MPPYDENLKATIFMSTLSEEMKQYAVTLTHDVCAKHTNYFDVAKTLVEKFNYLIVIIYREFAEISTGILFAI